MTWWSSWVHSDRVSASGPAAATTDQVPSSSRWLSADLRGDARLYRVGGDELAVLLPADEAEVGPVAARLVEAARRVRTTVSIGAAIIGPQTPEVARLRADRALYRAKSAGRDRYLLAGAQDAV